MAGDALKKLYNKIGDKVFGNKNGKISERIELAKKIFDELKNIVANFLNENNHVLLSVEGDRFVFYRYFGTYCLPNGNNVEDSIEAYATEVFTKNNSPITPDRPLDFRKLNNAQGTQINMWLYQAYTIDTRLLKQWEANTIFYKISRANQVNDSNKKPRELKNIYEIDVPTVNRDIDAALDEYISNIELQASQVDFSDENSDIDKPLIVTNSTDGNMSGTVTFSWKSSSNRMDFRPYTKSFIYDDKARTPQNCMSMLLNSCNIMLAKLSSGTAGIKSVIRAGAETDEANYVLEAKDSKLTTKDVLLNNTAVENQRLVQLLIETLESYKDALNKANNGIFDQDYEHSRGHNEDLQVYLAETLSPFTILNNKCKWDIQGRNTGFTELRRVVGGSGDNFMSEKSYIGFYSDSTQPLADSYIVINNKFIDISTKAGRTGAGAAASIASLRRYAYEVDRFTNEVTNNLTHVGRNCQAEYPFEFEIFDLLSSQSNISITDLQTIFNKYNITDADLSTGRRGKSSGFTKYRTYIEHKSSFTDMIMRLLQSKSYDIVQLNCTPSSQTTDWHFEYTCKYPAVFNGKVEIIFTDNGRGFTKFHIV